MPILAECNSCGRQYQAPEEMAGRVVRCKQCGTAFQIPGGDEPNDPETDLNELAELERSHHSVPGYDAEAGDDPDAPAEEPASISARRNVRFSFPLAKELDHWGPTLLTLGGLLWLGTIYFQNDETKVLWIPAARFAV